MPESFRIKFSLVKLKKKHRDETYMCTYLFVFNKNIYDRRTRLATSLCKPLVKIAEQELSNIFRINPSKFQDFLIVCRSYCFMKALPKLTITFWVT